MILDLDRDALASAVKVAGTVVTYETEDCSGYDYVDNWPEVVEAAVWAYLARDTFIPGCHCPHLFPHEPHVWAKLDPDAVEPRCLACVGRTK